ncbi:MAG: hypothetical protein UT84_C0017G0006 [Candidatus Curtissbacteria bacterium GW2011_GWA1_40_16]|uniref:Uncharacterized protein n=1 Tax=Candidatus Curtissbacteria bacterium GW2011_GWA1_40_16 TaxID=1618405 RepID=A0A0G0RC04_9BACT|nr:MAG: hypothetical protein UT84_C0017G0006 [Candidatus Curtissbacteria bacterium GW2011_GWA1_40_16]
MASLVEDSEPCRTAEDGELCRTTESIRKRGDRSY